MINAIRCIVQANCWALSEELQRDMPNTTINEADIEDLSNQIIAVLIVRWHQHSPQFQHPQRFYMGTDDSVEVDSRYRNFTRNGEILRAINEAHREEQRKKGIPIPTAPKPNSKHEGTLISEIDFMQEETYCYSLASSLLKSLYKRQIPDIKKVSHSEFIHKMNQYEQWCELQYQGASDKETLLNFVNFFTLQGRYQLDLFVKVATYMDKNGLERLPVDRANFFWIKREILPLCQSDANQILYLDRTIPIVFASDTREYEMALEKWTCFRFMQTTILRNLVKGGMLNSMSENLKVRDALAFFKESYNLFENRRKTDFGTQEHPNKTRINFFRDIYSQMIEPI